MDLVGCRIQNLPLDNLAAHRFNIVQNIHDRRRGIVAEIIRDLFETMPGQPLGQDEITAHDVVYKDKVPRRSPIGPQSEGPPRRATTDRIGNDA
jgi:hypothetical protein